MRKWVFLWFLVVFAVALFADLLLALAALPSVLLSYWIWRDGEAIKALRKQLPTEKPHLSKAERDMLEDLKKEV